MEVIADMADSDLLNLVANPIPEFNDTTPVPAYSPPIGDASVDGLLENEAEYSVLGDASLITHEDGAVSLRFDDQTYSTLPELLGSFSLVDGSDENATGTGNLHSN